MMVQPNSTNTRRHFLKSSLTTTVAASGMAVGLPAFLSGCVNTVETGRTQRQWDAEANLIKGMVKRPTFAKRQANIADFFKQHNENFKQALHAAIDQLASQGGGKVVVPKGDWLCNGPIHLQSNINLHLDQGATIRFSTNPEDYKPYVFTRWEGMELMGYSPLIYAFEKTNIAITGNFA